MLRFGNLPRQAALLVVFVVLFALAATPAWGQCGETTTVSPRRALGLGPPPLAVGDSVLYDAAGVLSSYGFETNAMVCRTMPQGIAWLQGHNRNLPVLVVIALGTNGGVTPGEIDQLLSIVGPSRILALVTPHNGVDASVPGLIRSAARQQPSRIVLLDWDRLSAAHADWFAPDGIHLGSAAGIDAYARLVASPLLLAHAGAAPVAAPPSAVAPPVRRPAPARSRLRQSSRSPSPRPPAAPGREAPDRVARGIASGEAELSRLLTSW